MNRMTRCWALALGCWTFAAGTSVSATAAPAGGSPSKSPPVLRITVSTGWGPPFLVPAARGSYRGLIPDWYEALAAGLGRRLVLDYVPPRRVALQASTQDLRCFGAREWGPLERGFVETAEPFMTVDEVLAGPADGEVPDPLDRLAGRRIGTVIDYSYPALAADFASGRLQREDAPTEIKMLQKQLQGRSDYVVIRRLTLDYLQRQDPQWRRLQASPVRVSSTHLYCAVREAGSITPAQLATVQDRLLREGQLQRLLARYTGGPAASSGDETGQSR